MSNPRIISGKARGFRLQPVPGDTTRPVTDRVKEALFNILSGDVQGSTWLDLFAGTGSIGIEALSRGAAFVRFIDINRQAINTIKANLLHTNLAKEAQVIPADAFQVVKQSPDRNFDYIYIAPPQYKNLWERAMTELDTIPDWLAPDGWVIIQIDPLEYLSLPLNHFREFDQRRYGSTLLIFLEHL